jgi:hypothetical protein
MRDQQTLLSNAQPITLASTISTDTYDQQGARNSGAGEPVFFEVRCVQAFNLLTSLDVQLISTTDAANTAGIVVHATQNFPLAQLTANTILWRSLLPPVRAGQYYAFRYLANGTVPTTGSIDALMTRLEIPVSFTNTVA